MPVKLYPSKEAIEKTLKAFDDFVTSSGGHAKPEGSDFLNDTLESNPVYQTVTQAMALATLIGGPANIEPTVKANFQTAFEMGIFVGLAAAGAREADEPIPVAEDSTVEAEEPVEAQVA